MDSAFSEALGLCARLATSAGRQSGLGQDCNLFRSHDNVHQDGVSTSAGQYVPYSLVALLCPKVLNFIFTAIKPAAK